MVIQKNSFVVVCYVSSVKENAEKYMEILEDKLHRQQPSPPQPLAHSPSSRIRERTGKNRIWLLNLYDSATTGGHMVSLDVSEELRKHVAIDMDIWPTLSFFQFDIAMLSLWEYLSCGSQLLQRVWEADLEACKLLIRGFQLKETSCCVFEEEENRMDEMEVTADASPDSEKRKEGHFLKSMEWGAVSCPKHRELKEVIEDISFGIEGHLSEEFFIFSAELGEKCEAISEKLVHLEDQLQSSTCRVDEGVIHILFALAIDMYQSVLKSPSSLSISSCNGYSSPLNQSYAGVIPREIQVVKEALQTVLVQLQSAKEAGEEKAGDFLCDSWCPGKQDLKE
ncbi:hypothetical protein DUI87_10260 [Hirundo rustica rustica]|uniref:Uncharacterized protein n=1 Tax=Hirundo rustica rustica TaxID=333673 RepID=A0A3M0KI16_HIRRU|nr:hypothetical protein DUI87_10260 [Hirundo rustica rustica]